MKKEDLKKGIEELLEEAYKLKVLLEEEELGIMVEFIERYQVWYTKSLKVVEFLAKDRLEEFIAYYRIDLKRKEITSRTYVIQDFVIGQGARKNSRGELLWNVRTAVIIKLLNQTSILRSLESRIDSIFSDIEGLVLSNILDKELQAAQKLIGIHERAAGALAGVVLESHLQKVAINHSLKSSKKNPTIADLNELLKSNNIIDTPTWRKVQYLGDIRNLCSHKKNSDPNQNQISDLISGVNEIIKNVF